MVAAEQGRYELELAALLPVEGDGAFIERDGGAYLGGAEEEEGRGVVAASASGEGGIRAAVVGYVGGDGSGEVVGGGIRGIERRRGGRGGLVLVGGESKEAFAEARRAHAHWVSIRMHLALHPFIISFSHFLALCDYQFAKVLVGL